MDIDFTSNGHSDKQIFVCSINCPPDSHCDTDVPHKNILNSIHDNYFHVLIVGDFNTGRSKCSGSRVSSTANSFDTKLVAVCEELLPFQHMKYFMRFRDEQHSQLDVVFTKDPMDINSTVVLLAFRPSQPKNQLGHALKEYPEN